MRTTKRDALGLSPRERDVTDLLTAGLTPSEIAPHLGLSLHTVYTYVKRIQSVLGVHSQLAVVAKVTGRLRTTPPPAGYGAL